jgi:hypothetical protein
MQSNTPAPADTKPEHSVDPKDELLLGDFHRWLIANDHNICTQSFGAWRPVGVNITQFLRERSAKQRLLAP